MTVKTEGALKVKVGKDAASDVDKRSAEERDKELNLTVSDNK